MSEKPSKEFRKYLIVPTEMYGKMHSGMIHESRLSDLERKMLNVLRDTKYSTTQRLKFYQQLLFNSMKKTEQKRKVTHEMGVQTDNSNPMSTQTDHLNNDLFGFANAAVGDELRRFSTPLKAFENPNVEDVFATPETNFGPPNQEEYFEGLARPLSTIPTRKAAPPFAG